MTNDSSLTGYDASVDSSSRSTIYFPTNSRLEYTTWTRRRLQEKNRGLEANFAPHKRIKEQFSKRVVGRGVRPKATSSDQNWNQISDEFFTHWASNPLTYSIDGSRSFWSDQRHCAEALGAGDGEIFNALVLHGGMPMVQPLDPFEIGSLFAIPQPGQGLVYEDGVRSDQFFRPLAYLVSELPGAQFYEIPATREVLAQDMVHVFNRRRTKQSRGLPPLYSGMNDEHDALDSLALAKASAKLHSLLAVSKVRKPQKAGQGIANQIEKVLNNDGTLDRLEERFKGGALTVELDEGEKLELHASQRPTIPELDGIKFYIHLLALASGLPFSVVFSFLGVGGTAVRGDLEDAQATFELSQDHLVWNHSHRIRTWRLAIAQQRGEIPRCRDPYWWKCDWHGPAKITVDYGRSAAANIDLVKSGMLSIPRYCEERGWDAEAEMRKQVDFIAAAQTYCAEKGVDYNLFCEATPGALPVAGAASDEGGGE